VAVPSLRTLRTQLVEHGAGTSALGLLVSGPGDQPTRTVAGQLHNQVIATLPDDPRTAQVLCHGGQVRMNAPLMRAAAAAQPHLVNHIRHRRSAIAESSQQTEIGAGHGG